MGFLRVLLGSILGLFFFFTNDEGDQRQKANMPQSHVTRMPGYGLVADSESFSSVLSSDTQQAFLKPML